MTDKPKKMADLPGSIQELLCAHESFRRLGFYPDEIKVLLTDGEQNRLHVIINAQDREFTCTIADWDGTPEEFEALWPVAVQAYNYTFAEEDILETHRRSMSWSCLNEMVAVMVAKGFKFSDHDTVCN